MLGEIKFQNFVFSLNTIGSTIYKRFSKYLGVILKKLTNSIPYSILNVIAVSIIVVTKHFFGPTIYFYFFYFYLYQLLSENKLFIV